MNGDWEQDEVVRRVAEELRRPVALDPWFDQRVMRAVRAEASASPMRRVADWFLRPMAISPVAAVLAIAVVAIGTGLVVHARTSGIAASAVAVGSPAPAVVPAGMGAALQTVQLVFVNPSARSVALVGDFNGWDPAATPMRAAANGLWTAEVRLPAGRHLYAFVVDGTTWLADPEAPRSSDDDFGKPNSVLLVRGTRS